MILQIQINRKYSEVYQVEYKFCHLDETEYKEPEELIIGLRETTILLRGLQEYALKVHSTKTTILDILDPFQGDCIDGYAFDELQYTRGLVEVYIKDCIRIKTLVLRLELYRLALKEHKKYLIRQRVLITRLLYRLVSGPTSDKPNDLNSLKERIPADIVKKISEFISNDPIDLTKSNWWEARPTYEEVIKNLKFYYHYPTQLKEENILEGFWGVGTLRLAIQTFYKGWSKPYTRYFIKNNNREQPFDLLTYCFQEFEWVKDCLAYDVYEGRSYEDHFDRDPWEEVKIANKPLYDAWGAPGRVVAYPTSWMHRRLLTYRIAPLLRSAELDWEVVTALSISIPK
jgi:hypothetical protein